jgi:cellulase/cellobiase CelA1
MKENLSPGPRKQRVFSPQRPVAALLVMTAALSFALLFASVGQTHAASSANVVVGTPTPTPPPLIVTITSPSNGSIYTLPAQIPFTASIGGVVGSVPLSFVITYYATLEPNGPTIGVGTVTQADPRNFTVTWVPPQAGTYSLMVTAEFIDEAGAQSGTSAPITVQINTPQISPTPAGGSCKVSYQLESQWSGGFNANVVLTNTSSVTMNGWTLAFTFPGDQKITQLWNGSYTQTSKQVTIVNLSYNGSIASGGTVNLGFNGTWVSNDTSPTLFTLNRMTCRT